MSITFSSCFYVMKSKYEPSTYVEWMNNFISIINHVNLVIYTDENSSKYIDTKNNSRIKVIIKPLEKFYNYKHKDFWIKNHEINDSLNKNTQWELNMLWCEKIWLVNETIENKYFDTDIYGWCDIGYFRNTSRDVNTKKLKNWCNPDKVKTTLNLDKIYYAYISKNIKGLEFLKAIIKNKNEIGLPACPIPPNQRSVAGGFFILHKNKLNWWKETFEAKLQLYIDNNCLVKDDQMIIVDCVFSNESEFELIKENNDKYDDWFLFQRFLR